MTDPLTRFRQWQDEAAAAGVTLPEAMTLATADEAGRPSARTVLLKGVDERGFVFFTNYESRKGRQLAENPHAALTFLWHMEPRRQVLVTGTVEKAPRAESEAYFRTRPLEQPTRLLREGHDDQQFRRLHVACYPFGPERGCSSMVEL